MMRLTLVASLAALACTTACTNETADGSSEEVLDYRVEVPEAPPIEEGIQFVQPDTIIPPGEERMTCWVPDWVPDRDYFVRRFEGEQGVGGHHVVALRSATPREAGEVFDCTDIESLAGFRPLILPDLAERALLDDDMYVRLPAGAKIVIQSHYINYAEQPAKVADVVRFNFHQDPEAGTEAGYFIMNHGAINLDPRAPGEVNMDCVSEFEQDLKFSLIFGHMHEMGQNMAITLTPEGGAPELLYEVETWQPEFRDLAPITFFDRDDPIVVSQGDRVSVNCAFENPLDQEVHFPREMCTAVAYYYPALPGEDRVITCGE